MYETRPFLPEHVFSLDLCNLDYNTENFGFEFYLHYFYHHETEMYVSIKNDNIKTNGLYSKNIIAYIIGKNVHETYLLENYKKIGIKDHSIRKTHVSALTTAPFERSRGLGHILMNLLEENGNFIKTSFCDLFVKVNNENALKFYKKRGYFVYRRVLEYYNNPTCDAFDMRKSLKEDEEQGKYFLFLKGTDINQADL